MRDGFAKSEKARCGRTTCWGVAAFAFVCLLAPRAARAQNFTVANNVFPSTPVGQSTTRSVTVTLNAALALQSIAIPAGFKDYSLGQITGCTIDGATVNPAGAVCTVDVTYTPIAPGSTASPMLARTAPLFVTDIESGNPVTYNFGLMGAATGPILALSAGTFTRYAGEADAAATDPGDDGLGAVTAGYAGDGGPARDAQFAFNVRTENEEGASPMVVDSAGKLFLADGGNYVIRRVDAATGNVSLFAGEPGVAATDDYDGGGLQVVNGVPATTSPLTQPYALMLDAAGDLYFLEQYSTYYGGGTGAVLREVNAATGIISTIAGSNIWYYPISPPYAGPGSCADPNHCGDGGPATAAFLAAPIAMTMDGAGNIYLYFSYGNIREINASTGIISTIATPSTASQDNAGYGMTMGADGNLYVANYDPNPTSVSANAAEYLTQVNPSTGVTAIVGGNNPPTVAGCQQTGTPFNGWTLDFYVGGLASDGAGNLYDFFNDGCNANLYEQQYETWMNLNSGLGYELYLYQGGYGDYGPGTIYNAVDGLYFFNYITNSGAAPDNLGNLYMMSTYNQVAKLSTSVAALEDYGSRGDGTTGGTQTVVVWNMGNATLTATVSVPVDYVLAPQGDASACAIPVELDAGQWCNLDIAFSPTVNGTLNESVVLTDENGQQAQVQLFGTGAGTPVPRGVFSPASYNFGSETVDSSAGPEGILFTNGGGAALTISSVTITGANAGSFSETNNCPSTLAAGASCTIQVTFTPGSSGPLSGVLTVTDNATDSPETANLTGTGIAPVTSSISINETIQVSDAGSGTSLTPSTLLAIGETIQVNDTGPGSTLKPSILLALSETIQVADAPTLSLRQVPSITWPAPAPIVYGAALSAAQLNATASVPGSSTYSPRLGAILGAGSHTLTVTFTPTDTAQYVSTTKSVQLVVKARTLRVEAESETRIYGQENPTLTYTIIGFVHGDTAKTALTGEPRLTLDADKLSAAGSYVIRVTAGTLKAANYDFQFADGTLTVTKAELEVIANNLTMTQGMPVPKLTSTLKGFVNGDTEGKDITGQPKLTTTATSRSDAGKYPIKVTNGTLDAKNYFFVDVNGTLTVLK
jgi:trimeric autotransporter adhesin